MLARYNEDFTHYDICDEVTARLLEYDAVKFGTLIPAFCRIAKHRVSGVLL